jgi:deazaflavin-dependent oxidoreductase (nitroreductase family)
MSRLQLRRYRGRGGYTRGGVQALVLETTGARTGEPRTAMLGYLEESDDSWLVMASLAGASRHPAWLHNLASQPEATIEFGDGRRLPVRAETLAGPELETAWQRIAVDAPEYARYRTKTDREIPVVRLRRR